jgi:hypothetical protein
MRVWFAQMENPFITVRKAEQYLDVAYNTAAAALRQLVRDHIITQKGDARRDRVFCAQALLDILEEPARLTASLPTPAPRKLDSAATKKRDAGMK